MPLPLPLYPFPFTPTSFMNIIRTFEFFSLAAVTFAVTIASNLAPSLAVDAIDLPAATSNLTAQTQIASVKYLEGFYVDLDWSVTLYRSGGKYHYQGKNLNTGATLALSGATVTGTSSQQIYTWNNKGTKYRIFWKTNDSSTIRLQVLDAKNRVILTRSLGWQNAADFV
jgi:hypothetical protein